jgi:ribosomal protein S13
MRSNKKTTTSISSLEASFGDSLNLILSQITSINSQVYELHRVNLIRLYLIKSTRGRSHALGKPSRGQRTWSNAWNSYKLNSITRDFISSYQKVLQKNRKEVKRDYRKVEKKIRNKERKKGVSQEIVRTNFWF